MSGRLWWLAVLALCFVVPSSAQTPMQVFGAWHCTADFCTWATAEDSATFDTQNHWMIDRSMNNTFNPSVNLIIFSFVHPVKLMNLTTDSGDFNSVPERHTRMRSLFGTRVRVIFSIRPDLHQRMDTALSTNPTQLGINARTQWAIQRGMEIDYENTKNQNPTDWPPS
jgi:hypothetical protein